jgi:hypothetical protein
VVAPVMVGEVAGCPAGRGPASCCRACQFGSADWEVFKSRFANDAAVSRHAVLAKNSFCDGGHCAGVPEKVFDFQGELSQLAEISCGMTVGRSVGEFESQRASFGFSRRVFAGGRRRSVKVRDNVRTVRTPMSLRRVSLLESHALLDEWVCPQLRDTSG